MQITRRQFTTLTSAGLAQAALVPCLGNSAAFSADTKKRKRLAVVTTIYRFNSHSDHIAGRFLFGYTLHGQHHLPDYEVVSMYVDQVGNNDLSRDLAKKFGFKHCSTIEEALTVGADQLNVDAVLFIGEHGDYPYNEYGQHLYPRHKLMSEIVDVFRDSKKSVPIFNDKHLSYSWKKAKEMYDWSKELNFPLQAGSSLPVTWRRPEVEFPLGTAFDEAVVVAYGGHESYGFHAFETLQCHVERRKGGETGIQSVQALTGDDVWKAADAGLWSNDLVQAALDRAHAINIGNMRDNVPDPAAYRIHYRDGFTATILMLTDHVADFLFAARVKGNSKPIATRHYLPAPPGAKYFDALTWNIERMYESGKAVIPLERTLLVSGALEALMHSKHDGKPIETPHLAVNYHAMEDSGYFRGAVDAAGQRE